MFDAHITTNILPNIEWKTFASLQINYKLSPSQHIIIRLIIIFSVSVDKPLRDKAAPEHSYFQIYPALCYEALQVFNY